MSPAGRRRRRQRVRAEGRGLGRPAILQRVLRSGLRGLHGTASPTRSHRAACPAAGRPARRPSATAPTPRAACRPDCCAPCRAGPATRHGHAPAARARSGGLAVERPEHRGGRRGGLARGAPLLATLYAAARRTGPPAASASEASSSNGAPDLLGVGRRAARTPCSGRLPGRRLRAGRRRARPTSRRTWVIARIAGRAA